MSLCTPTPPEGDHNKLTLVTSHSHSDHNKLTADHNMNSPAEGKAAQRFPFPSFPPFPFLPREPLPPTSFANSCLLPPVSFPSQPLSINLTGSIGSMGQEESGGESSTSSPNSGRGQIHFGDKTHSLLADPGKARGCSTNTVVIP